MRFLYWSTYSALAIYFFPGKYFSIKSVIKKEKRSLFLQYLLLENMVYFFLFQRICFYYLVDNCCVWYNTS